MVHPTTWATSSPLQPLVKISTNSITVYEKITPEPILNLQDCLLPPCAVPHHTRCTHTVQSQYTTADLNATQQYSN